MSEILKKFINSENYSNYNTRYLDDLGRVLKKDWGFYNSPISSYEKSFTDVLNGKRINEFIQNHENPVVIDLMAPPGTVYDLLKNYSEGRGLAVSLPDNDFNREMVNRKFENLNQNVTWLQGDVTHYKTWEKINKWLRGEKAHLIMERAIGGLEMIRKEEYSELINKIWHLLNPYGGVMLMQIPDWYQFKMTGIDIKSYIKLLTSEVHANYYSGNLEPDVHKGYGSLMISRSPESPSVLPILS